MRESVRQITEITTSTKSGFVGIFIANISAWWMDYGSVLVAAATGICGLAYVVIMVMLKWQEYKIKKRENRDSEAKAKEIDLGGGYVTKVSSEISAQSNEIMKELVKTIKDKD